VHAAKGSEVTLGTLLHAQNLLPKMKTLPKIASVLFCLFCVTHVLQAQVPPLINYQGRVIVGTTNFDGSGQFKFALVNSNGTTAYWSNDGSLSLVPGAITPSSQPTNSVQLLVSKGLYSVLLGDTSIANMTVALPASAFTNSDVRLRVWFNDGTNGSQLLTPDQRIAAVGYAFMADNIKDGAITSAKLQDGAVTSTKLGSGAVTNAAIGFGAVGTSQLQSGLNLGGTTTGIFSGNGAALTNLNVTSVGGVSAANVASGANLANGNILAPGNNDVFFGNGAGNLTSTGFDNTGVGVQAAHAMTSGPLNTVIGSHAGSSNTTGYQNTAVGAFAFASNTSGGENMAAGVNALKLNTNGDMNTATGWQALFNNTTGFLNTAVGHAALQNNAAKGWNTAIGASALLNSDAYNNIAVGYSAGINLTTGDYNIDIGNAGVAGESNTIRIGDPNTHTASYLAGIVNSTAINLPATTSATNGVIQMNGTPIISALGSFNLFLGNGAGNFALTGIQNTAVGSSALASSTTGGGNTATGANALKANTDGIKNTALGLSALANNTTASNNTAVGSGALVLNSTGANNTAIGVNAAFNNNMGSNNTALGYRAGFNLDTGSNNIDIGNDGFSGDANTIRIGTPGTHTTTYIAGVINGTFSGDGSGVTNLSAGSLTGTLPALNASALTGLSAANITVNGTLPVLNGSALTGLNASNITTGTLPVAQLPATVALTTGGNNFTGFQTITGDGPRAKMKASTANNSSYMEFRDSNDGNNGGFRGIIGADGLQYTGTSNQFTIATWNDSPLAFYTNQNRRMTISSTGNVGIGTAPSAATLDVAGTINIPATTSATNGVIQMAGTPIISAKGTQNLFLGNGAGNFTLSGSANTATGYQALAASTTASNNAAVGWKAAASTTTGSGNTAVGPGALFNNTTGGSNTAVGLNAAFTNSIGTNNTAIGYQALLNTTGTNNIGIGKDSGSSLSTGNNNIDIGHVGAGADSGVIRIGTPGTQVATVIAGIRGVTTGQPNGVNVLIDSSGQLGTVSSSRRYKEDVSDMAEASDKLYSLRPVQFRYKTPFANGEKPIQFGLIAEEVAEVFPELAVFNSEGQPETVKYQDITPLLLNEFLKEHRRVAALSEENATLRAENAANAKRLAALEARDKERDARLTRLEISMPPARPVANTVADNKEGEQ
jgi:hypothetical protein